MDFPQPGRIRKPITEDGKTDMSDVAVGEVGKLATALKDFLSVFKGKFD